VLGTLRHLTQRLHEATNPEQAMAFVVRGVKESLAVDAVTRYPTAPLTLLRLQSGSSPADVYPARCVLVCEEISIARIADVPVGQLAGGDHGAS